MDQPIIESILSPVVQYGFAGFAIILLCILVWMIKNLYQLLKDNTKVISDNSEAMLLVKEAIGHHEVAAGYRATNTVDTVSKLRETLLQRPCIVVNSKGI